MSQRAILLAVRDHLRKEMKWSELQCAVTYDGQPHPMAGEFFVAVYAGPWNGVEIEGRQDVFGVNITVSKRVTAYPGDRVDVPLAGPDGEALDKLLDSIAAKLHMDPPAAGSSTHYPVLALANVTITSAANGFITPLRLLDGGRPEPKGSDWFHADPESDVCGLAQTLTFGGAVRFQTIESQT